MKKFFLLFFVVCVLSNGFSQNRKKDQEVDIISHEVQLGESVRMISKKYLVDPAEIYKLNKFAVEGISQGMILKIPVPKKEGAASNTSQPIEKINEEKPIAETPIVKEVEQKITEVPAPNKEIKKIVITEKKTEVNHKVEPKETLFSLSKTFGVSVEDIQANNKEILKKGLQVGQIIVIPTAKSVDIKQSTSITEDVVKPQSSKVLPTTELATTTASSEKIVKHKVEPKETLYSLSKKYNITVDELKQQNEALLKNGLQIGQVLTIKSNN
jgi:LysM repeat protein